jgi:N,N'-diacetyllegionaminate synthase
MSPSATPVAIEGRQVGEGCRCYVIAEAGSNHNGKLDQALKLIDVAAWAGADAVKFQLFRAAQVYPRGAGVSSYLGIQKSIYEIFDEMEMPPEWLPMLAAHARECEVTFLASVFDEGGVTTLDPFVSAFKIASYEMTHLPLVRFAASRGKPLIVSTGTASLDEVRETVGEVARCGGPGLVLMQCTGAYPAPLDSLNLRAIATMKTAFGVPVGFSDHSRDPVLAPVAAVGAGANAIEKHFTLSNNLPGPDHRFAVEPEELRLMIQKIREAEQALGTGEKIVQAAEAELRTFARRSIFAVRDIDVGETLTKENIAVLRCGNLRFGQPPKEYPGLLGRKTRRAIQAESTVQIQDIE